MAVLSDDHFSAIGIKHCLLEGGITEVVIQQEESLDELCARAAVIVIDAGWSDVAAIDRFLEPARAQQLPALVIFQEARRPWVSAAVSRGASGVLTRGEALNHLPLAVQALRAGQTWMPQSLPEIETVPELSTRERNTAALLRRLENRRHCPPDASEQIDGQYLSDSGAQ